MNFLRLILVLIPIVLTSTDFAQARTFTVVTIEVYIGNKVHQESLGPHWFVEKDIVVGKMITLKKEVSIGGSIFKSDSRFAANRGLVGGKQYKVLSIEQQYVRYKGDPAKH